MGLGYFFEMSFTRVILSARLSIKTLHLTNGVILGTLALWV